MELFAEPMELSFLGSGYPLYFNFLSWAILLIGVIFMTSGQYNLISNLMGSSCRDLASQLRAPSLKHLGSTAVHQRSLWLLTTVQNFCIDDFIALSSYANKRYQTDFLRIGDVMNFSAVLFTLVILFFFRRS